MTGWSVDLLILAVGTVIVFYTVIGDLEAVIWTSSRDSWFGLVCSSLWDI